MGGFIRSEWPDGRSLVQQPELAIQAFQIVAVAVMNYQESQRNG